MSFFQLFEHFNVYDVLDPFKGKFMMIRFVIFHNWSQLVNSLRYQAKYLDTIKKQAVEISGTCQPDDTAW